MLGFLERRPGPTFLAKQPGFFSLTGNGCGVCLGGFFHRGSWLRLGLRMIDFFSFSSLHFPYRPSVEIRGGTPPAGNTLTFTNSVALFLFTFAAGWWRVVKSRFVLCGLGQRDSAASEVFVYFSFPRANGGAFFLLAADFRSTFGNGKVVRTAPGRGPVGQGGVHFVH